MTPLFLLQAALCFGGALILNRRWMRVTAATLGVVEVALTIEYVFR